MAAAAANLDQLEEKMEKEIGKLTKLKLVSDQNAKNLESAEKLNRRYLRLLEESQSRPNVTQIAVAVTAAGVGALVGNKIQKALRKYADEKKMVNTKGERSIGNIILSDVAVPVVGGAMLIGGAFVENGPVSAGMMGGGGGLAAGSAIGTMNSPKTVQIQVGP